MKINHFLPAFLLLCWISGPVSAQTDYDMDELARNTPAAKTYSVQELAAYFCKHIADDRGRVRAIYSWITLNIRYQDSNNGSQLWASPDHLERQRPAKVLQNRAAVCQGISNLFQALCQESGIECQVIPGIVKDHNGQVLPVGHAWVTALIQGKWALFDPTWSLRRPGNNWEVNDAFFMVKPEVFVLNHLPDDPAWQLLNHPIHESDFREKEQQELSALAQKEGDERFDYQDTLKTWIALDSASRAFAAETRVLRFNGSNQRVLFGLGQNYWGMFYDLRAHLDSVADKSILQDSIYLDTLYFASQMRLMHFYHARARALFGQITDPQRLAMTERFFTPDDVLAITNHLQGAMWTAVFENQFTFYQQQINEGTLLDLEILASKAENAYTQAIRQLDCAKLRNYCYEVWHNLSLAHLQLAERYSFFLQQLLQEKEPDRAQQLLDKGISKAQFYFKKAEEETLILSKIPPPYAFVIERLQTARQGEFTIQLHLIRAKRVALNTQLEKALSANAKPMVSVKNLIAKYEQLLEELDTYSSTIEDRSAELGDEYTEITLSNVNQELYALNFNLGNLHFRQSYETYQSAYENNNLEAEKKRILSLSQKALGQLQVARGVLDSIKRSGRIEASYLAQKGQQIEKLKKSIQEFISSL
jgi:hypothetical protein